MGVTTWTADYQGQRITVTNHFRWFPMKTWERLQIPGQPEQRHDGSLFATATTLFGRLDTPAGPALVEVRFAQVIGGLRAGCHILVDGELVGGDVDKKLNYPDPEAWKTVRAKGPLRFIATRGVLAMGLPYAFFMSLYNETQGPLKLGVFAFYALSFGTAMGYFVWRGANKQYEAAREARQGALERTERSTQDAG